MLSGIHRRLAGFINDHEPPPEVTTESDWLEALRRAAQLLGKSPTKAEYEKLGLQPASATVLRVVGGWNEAEERAGLETNPSTGNRLKLKPDDVDLPSGVSWGDLTADQRWHYRNAPWNTERTRQRRTRLRRWIFERKRESGRERCGTSDPECLDFHHPGDVDMVMAVGKMVTHGYGREKLRAEMTGCEIRCANCHRREHAENRVDGTKLWTRNRKRERGGCNRCGESVPGCLDYHHVDDAKETTVAQLISDDRSRAVVRSEMEKCEVLCANCHRAEHRSGTGE